MNHTVNTSLNNEHPRKGMWPIALAVLIAGVGLGLAMSRWVHVWPGPQQAGSMPTADASKPTTERKPLYWYDPMVPNQHFDKPGKSPFMDMELQPKYADTDANAGAGTASSKAPAGVQVDARATQSLGIRLAKVEMHDMATQATATGTITLNDRDVAIVQARAAGFVERVYPHAVGDVLSAGAPVADILVPEWTGAQAEYLAVKRTGDAALTQAARQRLLLLGMPTATVDRIERAGQPQATYTVTAPSSGVVQEWMVRNGMTVSAGMSLVRLNGLDTVWIDAMLPEALASAAMPGQTVEVQVPAYPGEVFKGRMQAVLPEGQADTRTLRLRIELPNKALRFKAGMSAQLAAQGAPRQALGVPSEALIRTGRRTLVYVAETGTGHYSAVEVQTGLERDGYTEIKQGLRDGQQVVASGPFLIDSEASMQGIVPAQAAASTPDGQSTGKAMSSSTPSAANLPVYEGHGRITELSADSVELKHEAIPALKWGPMTMPFALSSSSVAKSLKVGDEVRFRFTVGDDGPLIQSMQPMTPRKGAQP
jgi:Cu(I)/Ag(I) efflux system membrane fusion protein